MFLLSVAIFLAGILEDFINAWHVKSISRNRAFISALSDTLHVFVWYFVIRVIVENIQNLWLALVYAVGNGLGTYLYVKWQNGRVKNATQTS